jgi:hypothetical protein
MKIAYRLNITVEMTEDGLRRFRTDDAVRNRMCLMASDIFGAVRAGVDGASSGGPLGSVSCDIYRTEAPPP